MTVSFSDPPTVNMYPGYNPYILYEGQQKIKLTCVILDANPAVNMMYNWTNVGAPISGKVINIANVLRSDSGHYSCTATNMIGISNTIWKQLDVQCKYTVKCIYLNRSITKPFF